MGQTASAGGGSDANVFNLSAFPQSILDLATILIPQRIHLFEDLCKLASLNCYCQDKVNYLVWNNKY